MSARTSTILVRAVKRTAILTLFLYVLRKLFTSRCQVSCKQYIEQQKECSCKSSQKVKRPPNLILKRITPRQQKERNSALRLVGTYLILSCIVHIIGIALISHEGIPLRKLNWKFNRSSRQHTYHLPCGVQTVRAI